MRACIPRVALLLILLAPGPARAATARLEPCAGPEGDNQAGAAQSTANVNTRYDVQSVSITGVDESRVSQTLRDDIQTLVGKKYDPEAAESLARRLHHELSDYRFTVKVRRGDEPGQVKVVFEAERATTHQFDMRVPVLLFTNHDEFSFGLVPAWLTHDNYVAFGYVSNANDLLERNIGWVTRYEHRNVGTKMLQVGVEYDYFHPSFEGETESALASAPLVPGIYRTREVFTPSISILPIPDIRLTFGASFQTLEMQYPAPHDQAAHAFTFDAQFRKQVRPRRGLRHTIAADYSLRDANRHLESDFLYTRQWVSGDYTLRMRPHEFAFHFEGGHVGGAAPLYERFTIGSATTLRGWDKFDVAPLGGSRLLYGSLAYRYRPFELFYDFGTVWDPALGQSAAWKHSVGIGLAWRNGLFVSVGVPCRFHGVTPVFMFGFRPQGRG